MRLSAIFVMRGRAKFARRQIISTAITEDAESRQTQTAKETSRLDAVMEIPLMVDVNFAELLLAEAKISNICYLGNSEGWVNIKIKYVEK